MKIDALTAVWDGEDGVKRGKANLIAAYQQMRRSPDVTAAEASRLFDTWLQEFDAEKRRAEQVRSMPVARHTMNSRIRSRETSTRPLGVLRCKDYFLPYRVDVTASSRRTRQLARSAVKSEVRFASDSPLEGQGFDPSVPRRVQHFSGLPRSSVQSPPFRERGGLLCESARARITLPSAIRS